MKDNKPVTIKTIEKVISRDIRAEFNREFDLISNSGIQFLDFEIDFDSEKNPENEINLTSDDEKIYPEQIKFGKFVRIEELGNHYARFRLNKTQDAYVVDDCISDGREYLNKYTLSLEEYQFDSETDVYMIDSLRLYNGIWFPIPYFSNKTNCGPTNWARARVVNLSDPKMAEEKGGRYHLTLAFDTSLEEQNEDGLNLTAPRLRDIDTAFSFRDGIEATELLNGVDGTSYVSEWSKSILKEIYPQSVNETAEKYKAESDDGEYIKTQLYEKHYLNMLFFLRHFFMPNEIKLRTFDEYNSRSDQALNVSLILDIGNSRTCGLLVEEGTSMTSTDTFPNSTPLAIRDLNAPENVYTGAFSSRIQFQMANFDFNNCSSLSSRLNAFVWPSLARVGTEAANLEALKVGNEGNTGLNSPKRYLWKITDAPRSEWKFNSNSYQIPVYKRNEKNDKLYLEMNRSQQTESAAIYYQVSRFMNSSGDALFANTGDSSQLKANYTGKSAMTFMLIEIILQAMMQMNSFYYRNSMEDHSLPRKLRSIVLTTPPSMPDVEKELFRSCAYQALGIIWKAYGYDKTPATEFCFRTKSNQMYPQVPLIFLKWDETLSGQMVYLYNETQRVFNGNCKDFIKEIRRSDADGRFNEISRPQLGKDPVHSVSARIASIDIGGGTTDLVIADYAFPDKRLKDECDYGNKDAEGTEIGNQNGSIRIREVLKDGFKIAGDDLVLDIIRSVIIPKVGGDELKKVVGLSSSSDVSVRQARVQTVEQIFSKVAYRIISRLEALDKVPAGVTDIVTQGTVEDFILCKDRCNVDILNNPEEEVILKGDRKVVDESVIKFLNSELGEDFNLLGRKLSVDLYRLNYDLSRDGSSDLGKCLNYLNTIVNSFGCDVLLLTGRPSKIPGIRKLIESKSSLSRYRIIPMHSYRCGGWYPSFGSTDGTIGDPKSTVVVGALLGYTKISDSSKLMNFRIDTNLLPSPSPMRFFGALDNTNKLNKDDLLYKFTSTSERSYDDDISMSMYDRDIVFTKFNADDLKIEKIGEDDSRNINTELSLNLGYRQFADDAFMANMLYTLEPYASVNDLKKVKDTRNWTIPDDIELTSEYLEKMKNTEDGLIFKLRKVGVPCTLECAEKLENEFRENCTIYEGEVERLIAQREQAEKEQLSASESKSGIFGRLFGKKKEDDSPSFSTLDLQHEINSKIAELTRQYRISINRKMSQILEDGIGQYKDMLGAKLESIKNKINGFQTDEKMRFNITIDGASISGSEEKCKDSPITECIRFMRQEDPENALTIFMMWINDAKQNDSSKTPVKDFLNLRLKTVSGSDEEYWTNTGILLR
ncbi:MAG: virulence factor SrfB [Succinivibrio sp.]